MKLTNFKVSGEEAESLAEYIFSGSNPDTAQSAVKRIENVLNLVGIYEKIDAMR